MEIPKISNQVVESEFTCSGRKFVLKLCEGTNESNVNELATISIPIALQETSETIDLCVKSCAICKHYDIQNNICKRKDIKIIDRNCYCEDFELFE